MCQDFKYLGSWINLSGKVMYVWIRLAYYMEVKHEKRAENSIVQKHRRYCYMDVMSKFFLFVWVPIRCSVSNDHKSLICFKFLIQMFKFNSNYDFIALVPDWDEIIVMNIFVLNRIMSVIPWKWTYYNIFFKSIFWLTISKTEYSATFNVWLYWFGILWKNYYLYMNVMTKHFFDVTDVMYIFTKRWMLFCMLNIFITVLNNCVNVYKDFYVIVYKYFLI